MEAGAEDRPRVTMSADAVCNHIQQVAILEIRGCPYMGLDSHGGTVPSGVVPTRKGVGIPRGIMRCEVLGSGLGGPPAAEGVGRPNWKLDTGKCLHIEAIVAYRSAHGHPKLGVVRPAPGGQLHIHASTATDPPRPGHQPVEWSPAGPASETFLVCKLADKPQRIAIGRPQHGAPSPSSSVVSSPAKESILHPENLAGEFNHQGRGLLDLVPHLGVESGACQVHLGGIAPFDLHDLSIEGFAVVHGCRSFHHGRGMCSLAASSMATTSSIVTTSRFTEALYFRNDSRVALAVPVAAIWFSAPWLPWLAALRRSASNGLVGEADLAAGDALRSHGQVGSHTDSLFSTSYHFF